MTRTFRRIHWAALGANVGSAVLFTLLLMAPFLVGAHYRLWLLGLAIGIILGLYFYLLRSATASPARTPTRPGFHADRPALMTPAPGSSRAWLAAGLTLVVAGSAGLLGGNAWWLAVGSRPAWYSIPGLVLGALGIAAAASAALAAGLLYVGGTFLGWTP
jgi:hypothetical protein